jgi:hypothetical protein
MLLWYLQKCKTIIIKNLLFPHTSGSRDELRCGALSLLQKMSHYRGGSSRNRCKADTVVLFVKDSEYSKSTDAKPILPPGCNYLVSPGARCCCCSSSGFLLLLLRGPTPPRPPFLGGGKYQKRKSPVASGMAFGHVCVGGGVVEVAVQCKH